MTAGKDLARHMQELASRGEIELGADGVTPLAKRGLESGGAPIDDPSHECVVERPAGIATDYVVVKRRDGRR